jgi:hypothetical protein
MRDGSYFNCTILGKREKLQDVHNTNEADRFIHALFMSHVLRLQFGRLPQIKNAVEF